MKYTYAYKTSDGVRHEASIEADSREAVFESLRAKGIKAIKVIAADGSKANGEIRGVRKRVLAASVIGAVIVSGVLAFTLGRSEAKPSNSPAIIELRAKAAAITERHKADILLAGKDRAKILEAVVKTRTTSREVFKDILIDLKNENDQREAKRLYGELMILADHDEFEIDAKQH